MPISTTYTIRNTQGNLSFNINVGAASGPLELQQNADLTFYGYGRTGWGQEVDQNFYRLLEHFACQEITTSPKRPKTKVQLGGILGINKPVIGQTWYNLSDSELYICSDNTTLGSETWRHLVSDEFAVTKYLQINDASGTGPNAFIKLDGSNTPTTGFLELIHTSPTATWHAAPRGYVDDAIDTLTTLINSPTGFVHKTGDTMSGPLNVLNSSTNAVTNINQGSIELGRTTGTAYSPWVDFHSSGNNIDYDSRIIASGGTASIGQGVLELIGYIVNDGRTPTLANELTSKGYVDTTVNNAVNALAGTAGATYVKKSGDIMTGTLNMNGNRIANVAWPASSYDPARVDWVRASAYMPGGAGGTYSIYISGGEPGGGNNGDIWFQL